MIKKRIIVVNLAKHVEPEIRKFMEKEGYTVRKKSKWISEAIERFLNVKDYPEYVKMADLVHDFSRRETVYITSDLDNKLSDSIIRVRRVYPELEAVRSLIVRASITRRLVLSGSK